MVSEISPKTTGSHFSASYEGKDEGGGRGALRPIRVEIKVTGLVQGVSFRYSAKQLAESLALTGWVKNLADGSVEIVAEGLKADLEKLLEWARQGPQWAKVSSLEVNWRPASGKLRSFEIRF